MKVYVIEYYPPYQEHSYIEQIHLNLEHALTCVTDKWRDAIDYRTHYDRKTKFVYDSDEDEGVYTLSEYEVDTTSGDFFQEFAVKVLEEDGIACDAVRDILKS